MKPKLQLALDLTSLDQAISLIENNQQAIDLLDIVEAGTVLLASEGKKAISAIKQRVSSDKLIVADLKIADAARTIAGMFFNEGADFTTVISAADIKSMEVAHKLAIELHRIIQIELYGVWTFEMTEAWFATGINHIIYHHSRDGDKDWSLQDVESITKLQAIGYHVSVTGGLKPETIAMFKGLNIFSFIIGRSIYESDDIYKAIQDFKREIDRNFE